MVDSDRLRQVLFNLIGNAAKFTSKGSIFIIARCSKVTKKYADVRFMVSDTGIGIPKGRIAKLFKPFEQFDSSTTRQFGGTGLGLTICRQIVELMGGRIRVRSVEGKGSDFIVDVRLPFAKQTIDENDIEFVSSGQRVAVVGKSKRVSKLLGKMFKAHKVDASFYQKTDVLPKDEFDVIYLDNSGDIESVTDFIAGQPALAVDNPPTLVPVFPANCSIDPKQWESLGAHQSVYRPLSQTRMLQPINLKNTELKQLETDLMPSCLLYTSPSPRDATLSRMPSSA